VTPLNEDFTDKVGSASVDMVYIPGSTFTLGCESSSCDEDISPVQNITVSSYHITLLTLAEGPFKGAA
jgi:formylglycine-generating enzyme required for sulfatase activity